MFAWISANPVLFIVLAVILVVIVGLVFGRRLAVTLATHHVREGILALALRYERARRKGQLPVIPGAQVASMVINAAMARVVPGLPTWLGWLKPTFTPERVQELLDDAWATMLDLLDDGELNGTHPKLPDNPAPSGPAA